MNVSLHSTKKTSLPDYLKKFLAVVIVHNTTYTVYSYNIIIEINYVAKMDCV